MGVITITSLNAPGPFFNRWTGVFDWDLHAILYREKYC